ncbi:MAG: response regulator [Bacillota bacterium]
MNNILVIDQSSIIRLKIRSVISSPESNVLEANDLELVKNNSFSEEYLLDDIDLLILDIQFEGRQDFSLLNHIQAEDINLPIIVLSSNDRRETVLKTYNRGAQDYLLKPFDEQILKSKVDYYLKQNDRQQDYLQPNEKFNKIADYFKLDLLKELSRVVRSNTEFSVLKLAISKQKEGIITKDLLLSLMRGIDQIYQLDDRNYIILAPLTSNDGANKLVDRLNQYLAEHLEEEKIKLECLLSFPEDIVVEVEENKVVEYQHQIINKLFDEA